MPNAAVNQGVEERFARAASPANRFFCIYVIATTPARGGTSQNAAGSEMDSPERRLYHLWHGTLPVARTVSFLGFAYKIEKFVEMQRKGMQDYKYLFFSIL